MLCAMLVVWWWSREAHTQLIAAAVAAFLCGGMGLRNWLAAVRMSGVHLR